MLTDDHGVAVKEMPATASSLPSDKGSQVKADQSFKQHVFGSFWIDETEFALPVEVIQEVVNEPKHYTPIPLSPPQILGLFNLREMVVPVIDLRHVLGFPKRDATDIGKVAIIENGKLAIGLLFDDTGGVINSTGAARVNFQPSEEGSKDVVVEGVLKLDDGARMVQLLDPFELLKIEKLPRIAKKTTDDEASFKGQRLNCISFQLGHTNCAIDLRYVQEITNVPEVQKSAIAHGHILGNIELRGKTMPIVDFRGMIGNEQPFAFSQDAIKNRKLVILKLDAGHVGLLVYSIDSILAFFESEVLPFASVALPRHDIVKGCLVKGGEEIVILLDHEKLFDDPLLVDAARSCQEIYPSKTEQRDEEKVAENALDRSTYIQFSVGTFSFAFDISRVSEIITRPDKLLKPPYALKFVDGILNLRGELITLINPRILYNMAIEDAAEPKVLIFRQDSKQYGIVVDSVDEIITIRTTELFPVPSIIKNGDSRAVSEDVEGCLPMDNACAQMDAAMVLNIQSLINRCVDAEGMVTT